MEIDLTLFIQNGFIRIYGKYSADKLIEILQLIVSVNFTFSELPHPCGISKAYILLDVASEIRESFPFRTRMFSGSP